MLHYYCMKEKELTLNQAILIWWFLTWRVVLVSIIGGLILNFVLRLFVAPELALTIAEIGQMLIGVAAMVYFLRSAVNRNYLSKTSGSFRLAAHELNQDMIDNDPRFAYKKGPQPIDLNTLQK